MNYSKTKALFAMMIFCSLFVFNAVQANVTDGDKTDGDKDKTTTTTENTTASTEVTPLPHCEVPCGIYDDSLRVKLIYEHITTVEKAMNQVIEMSNAKSTNYNQMVRWVMNKEKHAEEIQEIVSQYFLHQRVKMTDSSKRHDYGHYVEQLTSLHEILVYAMKTKQTTDLNNIKMLRSAVQKFEKAYFHSH